ncbi:MAG: BspA family leucine-rich repeat surface protein, partial [Balneolales bacterium]
MKNPTQPSDAVKRNIKILSILLLATGFSLTPHVSTAQGTFYLDDNGVTIRCPGAQPGEKGMVDEVEYEAVDRDLLIQRRDEEADLSKVCTTPVTDMSQLFHDFESFNQPIGNWDVSNVTDMSGMFSYARNFNQPIEDWDVGNVANMSGMYREADSFNQSIGNWDVSRVTDMSYMFYGADVFNQLIGGWNVSNVIDMSGMFSY